MQGRFWLGIICLALVAWLLYQQSLTTTRATYQPTVENFAGLAILAIPGAYLMLSSVAQRKGPRDTPLGYTISGLLIVSALLIVVAFLLR